MGAAGDLSLVETVARGELQFFVPGLHLELFEGSRSGGGGVAEWLSRGRLGLMVEKRDTNSVIVRDQDSIQIQITCLSMCFVDYCIMIEYG